MANEPIRRVITGHDGKNVAKVILEGPATNTKRPRDGVASTLMWCSDRMPADISIGADAEDMGARILGTAPPENGSRFIVMEFAPGIASEMHRTETVDYIVMLSGEIEMDMDDSTVKLRAGDIMVQRGTNHAWVNRSKAPARLATCCSTPSPSVSAMRACAAIRCAERLPHFFPGCSRGKRIRRQNSTKFVGSGGQTVKSRRLASAAVRWRPLQTPQSQAHCQTERMQR